MLERLHKEIKNKARELAHGAQKSAKEVDKARNTTQKYIELLGQQTAAFESTGGKLGAGDDPYVVRRGVVHRLNKQILEENNHRNDIIAVQNNFQAFEMHVIQVMQQAMEVFSQFAGGQAERVRALYSDMLGAVQRIPPDFEWKRFVQRSGDVLVNPNEPPRTVEGVAFPNQDHRSTKALIEGSLERRSRNKLSFGYQTAYYVVTPSKFLHEFKDSDDRRKDPTPELSIYLPDAFIGHPNGDRFNIKGKDRSKSLSSKLVGTSELAFKAHSAADAERWCSIILEAAGATHTDSVPGSPSSPGSPGASNAHDEEDSLPLNEAVKEEAGPAKDEKAAPAAAAAAPAAAAAEPTKVLPPADHQGDHKQQEAGITGTATVASPTEVSPISPSDRAAPLPPSTTVSPQTTLLTTPVVHATPATQGAPANAAPTAHPASVEDEKAHQA